MSSTSPSTTILRTNTGCWGLATVPQHTGTLDSMTNIGDGLGAELAGGLTSLNGKDRLRRALPFARRFYISRIDSGWKSKTGLSLINRPRREILELAFGPPVVNFLRIRL